MLIIGEKEMETDNVSVRQRDKGDLGSMPLKQFLDILHEEIMDS